MGIHVAGRSRAKQFFSAASRSGTERRELLDFSLLSSLNVIFNFDLLSTPFEMNMDHLIGQRFSLISKSEIRYVPPVQSLHLLLIRRLIAMLAPFTRSIPKNLQ